MINAGDSNASWTCKVSLLKTHAYTGSPISVIEQNPSWEMKINPEVIHLATVTSKDHLEPLIKAAQDAVLTPNVDPHEFFKTKNGRYTHLSTTQEGFSPNTVHLEISDRNIPNLSFCDLPGIINQTEFSKDRYLIQVVRDLVMEKMEGDTTLILLACSMGSDIQTSSAASLVREARAEDRCVGVLTKPDLLQVGDTIGIWRDTLNGEKFRVGHGYFVTKQPSPAELERKIDHAEARDKERDFFEGTKPWTTELAAFKDRFGTDNLRFALSQKLMTIIEASLPEIIEKVEECLQDVDRRLKQFPPKPTGNSYGLVMEVLNQFVNSIQTRFEGTSSNTGFRTTLRKHTDGFKEAIVFQCPEVDWHASDNSTQLSVRTSTTPTPSTKTPVIELDDDEPSSCTVERVPTTPKKKRKGENGTVLTPNSSPQSRNSSKKSRAGTSHLPSAANHYQQKFKLEQIKQTLVNVSLSGIPDEYDSKALDQIVLTSLQYWHVPLDKFVQQIKQLMRKLFSTVLNQVCEPYARTPLIGNVGELSALFLKKTIESFNDATSRALKFERFKPMTMHESLMSTYTKVEMADLKEQRFIERANILIDNHEEFSTKKTEGHERAKKFQSAKDRENLMRELGDDEFQCAIEVMAKVRAYYLVATPRFIDVVYQTMHAELFGECKEALMHHLRAGMGLDQADCKFYGL